MSNNLFGSFNLGDENDQNRSNNNNRNGDNPLFPGFGGGLFGGGASSGHGSNHRGGGNANPPVPQFKFKKPSPLIWVFIVLVLLVGVLVAASTIWTEVLWYRQLNAIRVLLTHWGAGAGMFLICFLLAWLIVSSNLWICFRNRPNRVSDSIALREVQSILVKGKKRWIWLVGAIIGFFAGGALAPNWRQVLVAFSGGSFGNTDPVFGKDISFFVFKLPLIDIVVTFFLVMTGISLVVSALAYYLFGAMGTTPRAHATKGARIHMGMLLALGSLIVGVQYYVGRFTMVYQAGSPTDGAMYTDLHAILPARTILAIIALLIAALFVFAAMRGGWYLPAAGIAVTVVSALVIGVGYPLIIQQFKVKPNERELESAYIERNIQATLSAFDLDDMEIIPYDSVTSETTANQLREDAESTQQIRLLDPDVISPAVRQMQQSRPYYSFPDQLAVDRYKFTKENGEEEIRDTVIAVRDLNLSGLSDTQRNWVNDHTVYTHGFGVVAAYGNQVTKEGLPSYWESSLSEESSSDLGDYEKRVYFSADSPEYSVVGAPAGSEPKELNYADASNNKQVYTTFDGDGGPSIGNFWNKLLYAIKFRSTDLFFSDQVNSHSQILYGRSPLERVSKVAPYLTLDSKVYPAIVDTDGDQSTKKRLVWIVDGYTTTDSYPYAEHVNLSETTADTTTHNAARYSTENRINYMRNSVKAVVDAYDGSVTLYQWDQDDPILAAWQRIYPAQVKPLSEISGDLMSHLRYPEDIFKVQRYLLANYHVTNPSEFYTGGDQWRLSEDPTATSRDINGDSTLQPPYYLTMRMPTSNDPAEDEGTTEFSLTSVFIPGGEGKRAAMAGFMAVDSETGNEAGKVRENYGKVRILALPSDTTVPGPGQAQNNFNSDPSISKELNLQDQQGSQQGSEVIRGNLLTLPVGGGLLYVQPVYVQSTGSTKYPQLRSVLVGFGDKVGMGSTLKEALDQVFEGESGAVTAGDEVETSAESSTEDTQEVAIQDLKTVLQEANQAITDSSQALKDGDWTAYGEAQQRLDEAISKALELQEQAE